MRMTTVTMAEAAAPEEETLSVRRVPPAPFDLAALHELYEAHADTLRRAIIRLGGARADVDDLLQEAFLVALRKHRTFEGRSSALTWLYGITIRVVATARRRAKVHRFLGFEPSTEPTERRTPADWFEHEEASRLVYGALDQMAEKKRTVFILYEIEGLRGEEIAQMVRCPVKTVWTRLYHARREFAERMRRVMALEGGSHDG